MNQYIPASAVHRPRIIQSNSDTNRIYPNDSYKSIPIAIASISNPSRSKLSATLTSESATVSGLVLSRPIRVGSLIDSRLKSKHFSIGVPVTITSSQTDRFNNNQSQYQYQHQHQSLSQSHSRPKSAINRLQSSDNTSNAVNIQSLAKSAAEYSQYRGNSTAINNNQSNGNSRIRPSTAAAGSSSSSSNNNNNNNNRKNITQLYNNIDSLRPVESRPKSPINTPIQLNSINSTIRTITAELSNKYLLMLESSNNKLSTDPYQLIIDSFNISNSSGLLELFQPQLNLIDNIFQSLSNQFSIECIDRSILFNRLIDHYKLINEILILFIQSNQIKQDRKQLDRSKFQPQSTTTNNNSNQQSQSIDQLIEDLFYRGVIDLYNQYNHTIEHISNYSESSLSDTDNQSNYELIINSIQYSFDNIIIQLKQYILTADELFDIQSDLNTNNSNNNELILFHHALSESRLNQLLLIQQQLIATSNLFQSKLEINRSVIENNNALNNTIQSQSNTINQLKSNISLLNQQLINQSAEYKQCLAESQSIIDKKTQLLANSESANTVLSNKLIELEYTVKQLSLLYHSNSIYSRSKIDNSIQCNLLDPIEFDSLSKKLIDLQSEFNKLAKSKKSSVAQWKSAQSKVNMIINFNQLQSHSRRKSQ